MDPVTAPSSANPLRAGEEDEEHHEKKPVLKKVMDKVKKIKKVIRKKTSGQGNGDDQNQHGELDEGDEEYEEDEEMETDPAVHGFPTAGVDENQAKPRSYPDANTASEQNRSLPNDRLEQTREYESPVIGARAVAKETSGGRRGAGVEGGGEGLGLITEKFVGDLAPPGTEDGTNTGIDHSRAYERPATKTTSNELRGGEGGDVEELGNGLGVINEEFEVSKSPATAARRVDDGLGLKTKDFANDSDVPRTDEERNRRIEQSQVHLSPTSGSRTGVNELSGGGLEGRSDGVGDDLGVINMELIEDPAAPKTVAEMKTSNEQIRGGEEVEVSPELSRSLEAMAISSQNDGGKTELPKDQNSSYTGMVSSAASKVYGAVADAGAAVISKVKPDARKEPEDGAGERLGGDKDDVSPDLRRSLDAITVSSQNDRGETEHAKDQNSSYTGMVSSAASKVYGIVSDAGTAVISKVKPNVRKEGEIEVVEKQGGQDDAVSPDLSRSLEAMTVSSQNDSGETEPPKDQNSSYTGMVSSAASKVYGIVADAGTAVISKVKPDARKEGEGEDEAVGKQGKGISIKEYFTEKLTPGDDEKALSEWITEAGQKKKNETVELPPPEKTSSDEGGKGVGVVEKIRGTVTSFLGGGDSSPKSPATEARRKVAEDDNKFQIRSAEGISQEKGSGEELPTSYH